MIARCLDPTTLTPSRTNELIRLPVALCTLISHTMHIVSLLILILLMSELVLPFTCVSGCGQKFSTSKGLSLHKNRCKASIQLRTQVTLDNPQKHKKRRRLDDAVSFVEGEEGPLDNSEMAQAGTSIQVCSKYTILCLQPKALICRQLTTKMWICWKLFHCRL